MGGASLRDNLRNPSPGLGLASSSQAIGSKVIIGDSYVSQPSQTSQETTVSRFRTPDDARSPRKVKVNIPLKFCHLVLGLDHLHYGLWNGEPLHLEGLKSAQRRYSERLFALIPEGISSILDVGAGTGATGKELAERGYEVEGLSPDPYQQELFTARVGQPFHLGRFQEFEAARTYDLVLMSESSQYIWLDSLFPAVLRTAPGGVLLVADYFLIDHIEGPQGDSGHLLDAYLQKAADHGLELEHQEDITESTLPTLELATLWLDRYVDPSLGILGESISRRYPTLAALGRRLLRKHLAKLDNARLLMNPESFARAKRYQLLRFRIPDDNRNGGGNRP